MSKEICFLLKVNNNDFSVSDMNKLKKFLYVNMSLIHMHQVDDFTLDITSKNLSIKSLINYSKEKTLNLSLIICDNNMLKNISISNGKVNTEKEVPINLIKDTLC